MTMSQVSRQSEIDHNVTRIMGWILMNMSQQAYFKVLTFSTLSSCQASRNEDPGDGEQVGVGADHQRQAGHTDCQVGNFVGGVFWGFYDSLVLNIAVSRLKEMIEKLTREGEDARMREQSSQVGRMPC